MKKLLSLLLAFIMVMSIFTVPTFAVEKEVCTTSAINAIKTQNEAVAWLNSQNNATYDFNGVNGTQCVEFVKAYVNWLLKGNAWTDAWGRPTLNGNTIWKNSLWSELGWEVYENTPDFLPQPGDIFSAGTSNGNHTGVVISSNLNTAVIADANARNSDWSDGDPVYVHTITWRSASSDTAYGATHYIRPKFKNNTPHTHNYNTYVYYWASHPHYKCYKCSCGEVKENRNEPTYVSTCSECNHKHSYTTHSHYATEHPHYEYLKCSCGATQVNTSKTSLRDGCDQCYPGAPVVKVRAGSDAEYVQFYWDATKNTDEYELKICDAVTGERVSYPTGVTSLNYQVKLPAGDYIVYPLSIKNSLRDTDRWWTSGASVAFTVEEGKLEPVAETTFRGTKYELYDIAMPWTEAKAKCEELGGHLVTIEYSEEAYAVNELISKGNRTNYWIGLSDDETEGEWKNITGEPLWYTDWASNEPNNYLGIEDYATIIKGDNEWNDVQNMYASYSLGFVCEYYDGDCGNNAKWNYDNTTNTLYIYGTGEVRYSGPYSAWEGIEEDVENVIIGEGITHLQADAFWDCINVNSIKLPDTLEDTYVVKGLVFENTKYFKDESNWENGVLYIDNHLIAAKPTLSGKYRIKEGTISVTHSAFRGCTELQEVYFPESVKAINDFALADCSSLCKVDLPSGITEIDQGLFWGCNNLTDISLPDSIVEIGPYSFVGCLGLKELVIPKNVNYFYYEVFGDFGLGISNIERIIFLNNEFNIFNNGNKDSFPTSAIIYAYEGSSAHKYAEKYGREFVSLDELLLGDVDGDKKVSIMDATEIQMHIAQLTTISEDRLPCADTDRDTRISIMDATQIQMFIAQLIPEL